MEKELSIVYTNKAKCRDCYRCIRSCPVNAIKVANEQASIIPERCISCGTCIQECPQEAKSQLSQQDFVLQMLERGLKPAISIAPSFVVAYDTWEIKRMGSALRRAGFGFVGETSHAAYSVARETSKYITEHPEKNIFISSACPAIVNYIEKYDPKLIQYLVPVLSPAMAHAKMLKQKLGKKTPIVFVGPCIAKKDEMHWPGNKEHLDAVLTFKELSEIIKIKGIKFADCEESTFDEGVAGNARLYPVEGGFLKTAGFDTDMLSEEVISLSGIERLKELFKKLHDHEGKLVIEPLFCEGGCINGPEIDRNSSLYQARTKIIEFNSSQSTSTLDLEDSAQLETHFQKDYQQEDPTISENAIREVFAQTGKSDPENQLNCGACGYNSCREKAIAVINGLAESNMCIPYMRRLAEQKNDTLFSTDPNGIIVLDDKMRIQSINPAFKKMFSCTDAILGKPVSYLIDPEPFEKLLPDGRKPVHKIVEYKSYGLICHQIHYTISEEKLYVGIFVDITHTKQQKKQLNNIQSNAIIKAQELLDHQTELAQTMTRFLGENSARGEILLHNLMDALQEGSDQ